MESWFFTFFYVSAVGHVLRPRWHTLFFFKGESPRIPMCVTLADWADKNDIKYRTKSEIKELKTGMESQ